MGTQRRVWLPFVALVGLLGSLLTWERATAVAAPFAYIANADDNTVSVLDTASNIVISTVPVGLLPGAVAVNAAGTRAYVVNGCGAIPCDGTHGSVSVIDTASNTVTATVTVGGEPAGVALNVAGTRVYVVNGCDDSDATCFGGMPRQPGTVSVIDSATNTVVGTVGGVGQVVEKI